MISQSSQVNFSGLTFAQAAQRLKKYGSNELKKQKTFSSFKIFLHQFTSPLIYVLLFAGLVTFFLHHFTDTLIILLAVVVNTILGFYQEQKSYKSMAALNSLLTPVAKVIREGKLQMIEAKNLVPGDLVVLTIGSLVPADGLLVESTDLKINESLLTGESRPVWKKASSNLGGIESAAEKQEQMVFMGTSVEGGIGKMIVTKTGSATRLGNLGKLASFLKEEKTPLQIQIGRLAKNLALVVAVLTFLIFFLGKFLGYETFQIFTISVALAVAAIPEGLVVTLTVILSLGMQRILKRRALVRQLLATETLGSVSVICADKTGTLTEGKMRVIDSLPEMVRGFPASKENSREILAKAAVLCNDMRDPLEVAMMKWAKKILKLKIENLKLKYPRLDEIPFSPTYKYIATLHKVSQEGPQARDVYDLLASYGTLLFLSGAPEVVLRRCQVKGEKLKAWEKKFEEYGAKGYRLVGFAYKKIQNSKLKIKNSDLSGLKWLGVLIYDDPVRQGVKEAFFKCQKAGIKIKIITGDYLSTAIAVLEKLKIKEGKLKRSEFITGEELEKITAEELRKKVGRIILFARTTPEQKLKIVQALKDNGEVVAMMGDGVNDALALKQADIGIVVKTASDLAKETANMVLLDSNFATIVDAVEEGRSLFENIKKATFYLLANSFVEMILVSVSLFFHLPLPLTAAQILWINLFQDSFPAIALAFEPEEEGLMKELPRKKNAPVVDGQMKILLFFVALISPLLLTLLLVASWRNFLPFYFSQTLVFATLGLSSLFIVLAARSLRKSFDYNLVQNPPLIWALLTSLLLLLLAIYWPSLRLLLHTQPLSFKEWSLVITLGVLNLLATELIKQFLLLRRKYGSIR